MKLRRQKPPTSIKNNRLQPAHVWDTASHHLLASYKGQSAALASDGTRIAIADKNGIIRVLNPSSGAEVTQIEGAEQPITRIWLSPHGDRLVVCSHSRYWVFDVKVAKRLNMLESSFHLSFNTLIWAPDGKHLMLLDSGRCELWDTTSGRLLGLLDGGGDILKAVFSPDNTQVFAAGSVGLVQPLGSVYHVITETDPNLQQASSTIH
jgi:WD40 repeat protein